MPRPPVTVHHGATVHHCATASRRVMNQHLFGVRRTGPRRAPTRRPAPAPHLAAPLLARTQVSRMRMSRMRMACRRLVSRPAARHRSNRHIARCVPPGSIRVAPVRWERADLFVGRSPPRRESLACRRPSPICRSLRSSCPRRPTQPIRAQRLLRARPTARSRRVEPERRSEPPRRRAHQRRAGGRRRPPPSARRRHPLPCVDVAPPFADPPRLRMARSAPTPWPPCWRTASNRLRRFGARRSDLSFAVAHPRPPADSRCPVVRDPPRFVDRNHDYPSLPVPSTSSASCPVRVRRWGSPRARCSISWIGSTASSTNDSARSSNDEESQEEGGNAWRSRRPT